MVLIKKNESIGTLRRITVILVDQSDGNSLETAQTNLNIEVSKAGGAQASGSGNWGEVGEGEYYYEFGTTEVNTFGKITARFAKTGIREFKAEAQIVGFNPYQTLPTQSSINALNDPSQSEISTSVWGQVSKVVTGVPANIATQTDLNSLNDPTQTEINVSVWGKTVRTITATPQTSINEHNQSQTLINQLNDISIAQVQSIVNAEGLEVQSLINNLDADVAALNNVSTSQIQSIINAEGLEIQSLINALNDPTPSEINAVITTAHGVGSYVGGGGQTTYNAVIANQSLINNLDGDIQALNDPTPSEINAVITTAHGAGSYVGAGAAQTIVNKLDAIQTDTNTALPNLINGLNDPTSSAINAVITTAHGAGSYVGGGGQTVVNKLDALQTDVNDIQTNINALNDVSTSQVQSIVNAEGLEIQSLVNALNNISVSEVQSIVNAAGGTSPTSIWNFSTRILTGMTQTDINEHNATQSLINALNDVSVAQVQSIINTLNDVNVSQIQSVVNAEGLEVQSLINALNDVSTSEVQSIVNAQGLEVQSLINAMQSDVTIIKGLSGLYLVAEYTHNSSNINTKIEFWHYSSQTNKNTHDKSTGLLNTFQLDVTLTGQLASVVKMGD